MSHPDTLGVIVAGGLARRMGGTDKMRIRIGDATILEHVLTRLRPQCARSFSTPIRYRALRRRRPAGRRRQRAGFSRTACRHLEPGSILRWHRLRKIDWIVSAPSDCPFLPRDLVPRSASSTPRCRRDDCVRGFGRAAPSGHRALARGPARGLAARAHRGRRAQSRRMERAIRCRSCGLAHRAGRSVL